MTDILAEYLYLEITFKFALALLLAGVVGLEREWRGRAAGLRTHVLVCLGSTLTLIVSDLIAREWNVEHAPVWLDKGRIAAGVITGVGFLGAGTIIQQGNVHRGLTTAAMIWFSAAQGIAIGLGYYGVAIIGTGFALVDVLGLRAVRRKILPASPIMLKVRVPGGLGILHDIERAIARQGFEIKARRLAMQRTPDASQGEMQFEIAGAEPVAIEAIVEQIQREFETVESIECEL